MNRLRGYVATAVLAAVTLPLIPLQSLAVHRQWRLAERLPVWWHRFALRCLDIRIHVTGTPADNRPLLLVCNHASWLDILVLGSVRPLSFIAKMEVASWPVFGTLARLQRTVFVDRARRTRTAETNAEIAARMRQGDVMLLFPEGTTSDGNRLLPFRSALIGAARTALAGDEAGEVWVQPLAIGYTRHHGLPLGREGRHLAGWPGEVEMVPHLKQVVARGAIDVEVRWGTPRPFDAATDRKALTRDLEADVRRLLRHALTGRAPH